MSEEAPPWAARLQSSASGRELAEHLADVKYRDEGGGYEAAGNPTAVDSLFSFISSSGGGSLRMGASNTNHALLGNAGEPDIASILRSGKQSMF